RPTAADGGAWLRRRAVRLLVPWLFWSLAIAGVFALRATQRGEPAWGWTKATMLLYGPEIHLWFLPFLLVATAGVRAAGVLLSQHPARNVATGAFALGAVALALCPLTAIGWPFEQGGFSVPALCLGFGRGRLLSIDGDPRRSRLRVVWLTL